jgi:hypothetical protein
MPVDDSNERITGHELLLKVRNGSLILATQIFRLVLTSDIQENRFFKINSCYSS